MTNISAACAHGPVEADACDAFVRRSSLYFSPEEAAQIRKPEDVQRLFPSKVKIGDAEVKAHCQKSYSGIQKKSGPKGLREFLLTHQFILDQEGAYRKEYVSRFIHVPSLEHLPMSVMVVVRVSDDGNEPVVLVNHDSL